jgi:hypothetical protein
MLNIIEKTCIKCCVLKQISEFGRQKQNKDGYNGKCKLCIKQYNNDYRQNNEEKLKKFRKEYNKKNKERFKDRDKKIREKNKDEKKKYNKIYQEKNKEKIREQKRKYLSVNRDKKQKYRKEYYLKNKEKAKERACEYYKNNKNHIKQYKKKYRFSNKDKINKRARDYRNNNINAKIASLIRTRIRETLKLNNAKKSNSSMKLLGCSVDFLREYLELKFTNGMTWENHGLYGWHIDHIIPCSLFNLEDKDEQKLCFHYTNLQPLWATREIAMKYGEDETYVGNLEKGKF